MRKSLVLVALISCTPSDLAIGKHQHSVVSRPVAKVKVTLEDRISLEIKKHKSLSKHSTVSVIDYSLPIEKKRFFVFDQIKNEIIYQSHVGHAGASGTQVPFDFSNVEGTKKTSLGIYKVGVTYKGSWGVSKNVHGLSESNSKAYKRRIVIHSMKGDKPQDLYSWGCFTFFEKDYSNALSFLEEGSMLLVFK